MRTAVRALALVTVVGLGLLSPFAADAASITYAIENLNTTGTEVQNTGQTFTGQGYLESDLIGQTEQFGWWFGTGASSEIGTTALQVDISGLAGATVSSAVLAFHLESPGSTNPPADWTFTSFSANGTLAWWQTAPDNLGSVSLNDIQSPGDFGVDVTSLLATRVGADWFGLHIATPDLWHWTYTYSGDPDAAQVRLVVEYDQCKPPVPEPASMSLLGLGIAGMALRAYRRRAR